MADEKFGDVFAVPDFWKPYKGLETDEPLAQQPSSLFNLQLQLNESKTNLLNPLVVETSAPLVGFFKLPETLKALEEKNPAPRTQATPVQRAEEVPLTEEIEEEDLWLKDDETASRAPQYRTWDALNSNSVHSQVPLFITEQGPGAYDAFLSAQSKDDKASQPPIIGTSEYCACLLALALGRGSILFSWDGAKKSFVPELDVRVTGCSAESLKGVQTMCIASGTSTRFLKMSSEKMHTSHATPSRVALANMIDQLLMTIQSGLGARGQKVRSVLQLQAAVRPVYSTLTYFRALIRKVSRLRSDEQLISLLFEEAQAAEHVEGFLRDTVREMLQTVSKPWRDFTAEWTGLRSEEGMRMSKNGPSKSFVQVRSREWVDDSGFELEEPDYFLDEETMPSFIPADIAQLIFQTGRNLRFLWENHPDHPLSHAATIASAEPPSLQWQFDWDAISRVERKAADYELALKRAIRGTRTNAHGTKRAFSEFTAPSSEPLQIFGRDEHQIEQFVLASIANFNKPPPERAGDSFTQLLKERMFQNDTSVDDAHAAVTDFNPHWSLIPLLSFAPIISAQARVVNRECSRVLFNVHNLRQHLSLQKDFQLFGNGLFCSRLSHALFDSDMDTAERQRGVALTGGAMGLRLGGRQTWPPASSELRLALMGVLTETYQHSQQDHSGSDRQEATLPGDMSFAVRNLSEEEMEACMDPQSLEALDFLRLSYKPPSALLPVITPPALVKYDKIFKLLLRVLRILYVVNQLFRDISAATSSSSSAAPDDVALRFRIEAHHFISSITAYFLDTGIAKPWGRFSVWLDGIEAALRTEEADDEVGRATDCGPDRLREHHERALDDVMLALLLRKRQQPVLKLLEDIFASILQFAQQQQQQQHVGGDPAKIRGLYASFRKKVEVFTTVCRGLSEKGAGKQAAEKRLPMGDEGGGGGARGRREAAEREEGAIGQLVLLLDMTGYYLRKPPGVSV